MTLKVGSLFSGIGGLDLGFERAGFEVAWQCEIDKHARAVLARRFPGTFCYEDVKEVGYEDPGVDVLVGGFPCQDVSVAGRRAGLAGERSGLWFEFHRILRELRPGWVVIENVPGLLSSNGGRDFAVILRGLVELGYGVCWRVLDAQYLGVAQRRRRVFVVGHLGDGRAAEVLFEREGVPGHPPARRAAGQGSTYELAPSLTASGRGVERTGDSRGQEDLVLGNLDVADCLTASMADSRSSAGNNPRPRGVVIDVANAITASAGHHGHISPRGDGSDNLVVDTLRSHPRPGSNSVGAILISRRGREDGGSDELEEELSPALRTGGGRSSVSQIVFAQNQRQELRELDVAGALSSIRRGDAKNETLLAANPDITPAMTAKWAKGSGGPSGDEVANHEIGDFIPASVSTLAGGAHPGGLNGQEAETQTLVQSGAVRRLTPVECERLQGFPDGWTEGQADSHRYRQLGNAVCVPVAEWIARRIVEADAREREEAA